MYRNRAFIILLALLLVACTSQPISLPPTATLVASPGVMRIASELTPTPAHKFDLTPKPTKTSKPAPTRTALPTYTPAKPAQGGSASYKLREWTAEQADLMIEQIASHLKAIEGNYVGVRGRGPYREQYQYLALAEAEALQRFPDAPQAETWRWDVCYNWAFYYYPGDDTTAPELPCYAKLIENGLNSGQTNPSNLSDWFKAHESRLSFEIASQTPPQGYTSSHIITLDDSSIFWLTEKNEKFQAVGLMSNMFYYSESSAKFQSIDLTGDQFPELILYFYRGTCCGVYSSQFIYDVSSGTPRRLNFVSLQGTRSQLSGWNDSVITKLDGEALPGLLFESYYGGDPLAGPCGFSQYEKYIWNNNQFELMETWYKIRSCSVAIDPSANQAEINIFARVIGQMEGQNIRIPEGFSQLISFRWGEYYAQAGNYEKAYHFFSDAATAVSNESNAEWIQAAKTLLKHYKKTDDFYLACAKVEECDMQSSLQGAIETINPDLFPAVREALQAIGIPVKDGGVFDFDEDGSAEQWIVVQHPGKSEYEFWVLAKSQEKINALFVSDIPSETPQINRFKVPYDYPTIELKTSKGKTLFSLQKMEISSQPYILLANPAVNSNDQNEQLTAAKAFWQESLDQAASAIFTGTDPATVKETLLGLKKSTNYDCKTSPCDQLFYLLGLTNELTDDQPSAVDAYLQLWQDYPDSIYTIMARSKLDLVP